MTRRSHLHIVPFIAPALDPLPTPMTVSREYAGEALNIAELARANALSVSGQTTDVQIARAKRQALALSKRLSDWAARKPQ